MTGADVYRDRVHAALPRLLALYDDDPSSPTYGAGDRLWWAWKLLDFANGTFQAAAHGLARLVVHGLLPNTISEGAARRRIDAMVRGAGSLRDGDGSLAEAFPRESSFCVTALVAHDLLLAVELLGDRLDARTRARYQDVIRPMVRFLHRADERHGVISNHLATAAAALYRWTALTGEAGEERGRQLLGRVLEGQSSEGWFREYQGADPGYQSLCTDFLADLHLQRPDLGLLEPLRRSLRFLAHFAHPDGSFGGHYGSRNTRFYFPAGVEALAGVIPEAASLAAFMRVSISHRTVVTLDAVDASNLVPMFNSYCWAVACLAQRGRDEAAGDRDVPCRSRSPFRRSFPHAGLMVDRGADHYTVVSWHKGGVCYHFGPMGERTIDAGVLAVAPDGTRYSSQSYQPGNAVREEAGEIAVDAAMVAVRSRLPTPAQFVVLRLLSLTVMRSRVVGDAVKRVLVWLLVTRQRKSRAVNRRTIRLGPAIAIHDQWRAGDHRLTRVPLDRPFSAIHMASQGYWQRQDDET